MPPTIKRRGPPTPTLPNYRPISPKPHTQTSLTHTERICNYCSTYTINTSKCPRCNHAQYQTPAPFHDLPKRPLSLNESIAKFEGLRAELEAAVARADRAEEEKDQWGCLYETKKMERDRARSERDEAWGEIWEMKKGLGIVELRSAVAG